jgi:hypothetical protein
MVMSVPAATAPTATTGLRLAEGGAPTGDVELDRFPDRLGAFPGADIDADLLESGEGAPAHAAGEEHLDPLLLEQVDGRHAATLLVPPVLENGHLSDGVVGHRDQGERGAVTEVLRDRGVEAVSRV